MNAKRIGKISAKARPRSGTRTDWGRVGRMTDAQIERAVQSDPEIHGTTPAFWKDAKVVFPQRKQPVTIRLDADLLEWLRRQKGYQTRINAVLRTFMEANRGRRVG